MSAAIGLAIEERMRIGAPGFQEVQQRVGRAARLGASGEVEAGGEPWIRFPPFGGAVQDVVQQGIHARLSDVRIAAQVVIRIEQRVGTAAVAEVVSERIGFRRDFLAPRKKFRIEQGMRIAPLEGAAGYVMPQRSAVPGAVEDAPERAGWPAHPKVEQKAQAVLP